MSYPKGSPFTPEIGVVTEPYIYVAQEIAPSLIAHRIPLDNHDGRCVAVTVRLELSVRELVRIEELQYTELAKMDKHRNPRNLGNYSF